MLSTDAIDCFDCLVVRQRFKADDIKCNCKRLITKLVVGNRYCKLQRKIETFLTNICIQFQLNCIRDNLKYKKKLLNHIGTKPQSCSNNKAYRCL